MGKARVNIQCRWIHLVHSFCILLHVLNNLRYLSTWVSDLRSIFQYLRQCNVSVAVNFYFQLVSFFLTR